MDDTRKITKIQQLARRKNALRTVQTLRKNYLTDCSSSNTCFGFGTSRLSFKKFFHFFNFDFIDIRNVRDLRQAGANGFTILLPFQRQSVKAAVLLKAAKKKSADNLFYEGVVGLAVNKLVPYFPCFVETYGCFQAGDKLLTMMQTHKLIKRDDLKSMTPVFYFSNEIDPKFLETSCDGSFVILTEYLVAPYSLHWYQSTWNAHNRTYMAYNHLFQIYSVLDHCDEFEHNDLHANNVLIYRIPDAAYVTMRYHYDDEVVELKTLTIAKIIDYGRVRIHGMSDTFIRAIRKWDPAKIHNCGFEAILDNFYPDTELFYRCMKEEFAQERKDLRSVRQIHAFLKTQVQSDEFLRQQEALVLFRKEMGVMNIYLDQSKHLTFKVHKHELPTPAVDPPPLPNSWRCSIS